MKHKIVGKYSLIGIFTMTILTAQGALRDSTMIWDADGMKQVKTSLAKGEKKYTRALAVKVAKANAYLNKKPLSVMDKKSTPPSGDKHDFMTWAIYWWPNPDTPDGKPYIHKDGRTNPEVLTTETDGGTGRMMFRATPELALAYYYTDDEKYAKKAAEILRIWFIAPETRMNPNLNYAEGVPGRSHGRCTGIITFSFRLHYILDSIILIRKSPHWSENDDKAMCKWLRDYMHWLNTSKLGAKAKNADNNHGTWFAEHMAVMQLYLGNKEEAVKTVKDAFERLFAGQFAHSGGQLHELKRTRSFTYSAMNITGWINMCKIAELGGYNIWNYTSKNNASVKKGIEFLVPFIVKGKWQYKQIRKVKKIKALGVMQRGYNAYGDELFLKAINSLPARRVEASDVQLKFPLKKH